MVHEPWRSPIVVAGIQNWSWLNLKMSCFSHIMRLKPQVICICWMLIKAWRIIPYLWLFHWHPQLVLWSTLTLLRLVIKLWYPKFQWPYQRCLHSGNVSRSYWTGPAEIASFPIEHGAWIVYDFSIVMCLFTRANISIWWVFWNMFYFSIYWE